MGDIRNMFNKMKNGTDGGGDAAAAPGPAPSKAKPGSIEQTYQKKSQLEHILLRPDTYIGSVEKANELMWIYDVENECMKQKQVEFVPGLYKIFDEILVNAADNKQRDKTMDCIKIEINPDSNLISVWNNGKGIPVVMHKEEKMYVPSLIFGHLLTSSNYNDEEEKVTGGRNGYGAKLCNIFSEKFTVETACREYKRQFKQTWGSNMSKASEPKIKDFSGDDFTKITFCPDLAKFKMDKLDEGIVGLMSRRAFDVAASTRGVKVFLNGKRVPVKNFQNYIDMFVKNENDENTRKIIYENCNERWEVAVSLSDRGFQQISFVNSIATTKGGRHVDYVTDMIVKQLIEVLKKKNKGGTTIKPFQVKNHMWIFINCLIVNPTFDSQTKENMTLQMKSFGSKCQLSEKFVGQVVKSGIVESVLSWAKFKAQNELSKTSGKKQAKLKGIPKLEDANEAGTKNALKCTLILTEGDSAKTLAVSGLGIIGRDYYGVFPLRGKLLNVREATHKQILENAEINNLIKILGLQYKKKYNSQEDMKTLRYGKVMIMTDQDQDGSHIKGLLINFIHYNWPELLRQNFLEEFITPIVKATKKDKEFPFYSIPEFEEWKKATPNHHTFNIKYYKGLGTSTSKEAKEYFQNMARHRITFRYEGQQDDDHIVLAFSKKHIEHRKEWLTNFMKEVKRRKEFGLDEKYLYEKNTKSVSYKDFVNLELVLFSNMDNVRSIPCLVDGLKPGQRKVLFTCFKRNDKKEVKVAQLSGSVAEMSAYHHGEQSLCMTIVNLAQNFVGSNNINLLEPRGQFGTRLVGGKDSASARYIFTKMSPLTRMIFHPSDDPLLKHEYDDNQRIEPVWYIPIIPMLLVNGADGIGTGWMTKIPNYNPREIATNIKKLLKEEELTNMIPWYKNFKGTVEDCGENRYVTSGEVSILNNDKIEITELPIGTWTQNYKENLLEVLLHGNEKVKSMINDYKEYNTDTTVKFIVSMSGAQHESIEKEGYHKVFKLQSLINTSSMCAFDDLNCLRRFDSVMDILQEFFKLRLKFYEKRKTFIEGMLDAEARKLSAQARFIVEKCDGTLVVENKKRKTIITELRKRGYEPDAVKAWKSKNETDGDATEEAQEEDEEEELDENAKPEEIEKKFKGLTEVKQFDYLLGMSMWMLTEERKNELLRQRDQKLFELETLKKKSPADLWVEDLDVFLEKLDIIEEKERQEELGTSKDKKKAPALGKKRIQHQETMPSPMAQRIAPTISDDLKKKIQYAKNAKENKGKEKTGRGKKAKVEAEKDEFDNLIDGKTLKDKLGTPDDLDKKKKLKQTKLNFKKKEKANGSPKKKKNEWETDDEDDLELSGSDVEFSITSSGSKERSSGRTARKVVKYNDDSESASESDKEPVLYDNDGVKEDVPSQKVVEVIDASDDDDFGFKKKEEKAVETSDDLFDSFIGKKLETEDEPSKKPAKKLVSDDDDDIFAEKKEKKAPAKSKKVVSDDSDDMFAEKKEKAPPKRKRPVKKASSQDDLFDEVAPKKSKKKKDESDDEVAPKKSKKKKDESDDEVTFGKAKKKPAAKKKKIDSDSEMSDYEPSPVVKPSRTGRAKATTKYVFSDSE